MISVIIPTKNRSQELKRAINSVLKQTHQDFEVLVVDDHSEEDIQKVVKSFEDDRIHYFKSHKQPSNANVCRNIGIENAKGEFIAMLDSDDEWLHNHLESKLAYLIEHNADGVFGSFWKDNGDEKELVFSRPFRKGEKMINYILSDGNAVTPSQLYKTSCVKNIMWDETLLRHQDFDFSVRFASQYKFIPVAEATTVVHWKKGERRTEHFESMMQFIYKNKENILPINYCKYHRQTYCNIYNRKDIETKIKRHYKLESVRFIKVLTLTDYLSSVGMGKSKIGVFMLRFQFCFKVLISK